jgi:glycolate oxidase
LHPLVLYDPRAPGRTEAALAAANQIIQYCVEVGGSLTGEHGVGMEKSELMPLIFSEADFALMRRVHDAFNPHANLNPAKIFPMGKGCGEIRVRHTGGHPAPPIPTNLGHAAPVAPKPNQPVARS